MKTKMFNLFLGLLLISSVSVFAQESKTETKEVKVSGACSMCENRIETAATEVEGVTSADWDKETQLLTLKFDPAKTSQDKIELAVVKVGHDTENHKADDKVYEELAGCCKYRDK